MPAEPFCANPKCQHHKLMAYPRQLETLKYEINPHEKYDFDYWEKGKMHPKEVMVQGKVITRRLIHVHCNGQEVEGYLCEVCVHALEMMGVI